MKKINSFFITAAAGLTFTFFALFRFMKKTGYTQLSEAVLPKGFPGETGLLFIWGFLFLFWGAGCYFVFSVNLPPRRQRNIFLNTLILILTIFVWNYLLLGNCNFSGALAVLIAALLLSVVVWFMYLVTHRYGGYLFIPLLVWQLYLLYLNIALLVNNPA